MKREGKGRGRCELSWGWDVGETYGMDVIREVFIFMELGQWKSSRFFV